MRQNTLCENSSMKKDHCECDPSSMFNYLFFPKIKMGSNSPFSYKNDKAVIGT